jgi:hypothetical protein
MVCRHFSQRTHLIHSIQSKTHVLGLSELFRYCTKVNVKLAELAPEPLYWTQNSCFVAFRTILVLHESRSKIGRTGAFNPQVAKRSCVEISFNERTSSTPLDPKLMFWGISDHFVTARKMMQNWPNRCHYRTSSLNEVALKFFATKAPDPLHWTQNSCFGVFRTVSLQNESSSKTSRTSSINAQVR